MVESIEHTIRIEAPSLKPSGNGHKMLSLADWRERVLTKPRTNDLIQDILPDYPSEYMLLCGRSGIGKTNLALYIAFCLATGEKCFSFKTEKCNVGYLVFEGAETKLLARIDKLLKTFTTCEDNFHFAREMPFKLQGPGIQKLQGLMEGLKVIFIDPIRYIVPGDYNKPSDASNFITTIKTLCQKTGTIAILLHHVKKNDGRLKIDPEDLQSQVKGPTDYVDSAGTLLLLEKARQSRNFKGQFGKNPDDRILHFCKVKDSPAELSPLNLQFNRETLIYQPVTTEYSEDGNGEDDF